MKKFVDNFFLKKNKDFNNKIAKYKYFFEKN